MLGYGPYATNAAFASEQAVSLPTAPQALTATVVGVRLIALKWVAPADTGVGGTSRGLTQYLVQRSASSTFTFPTDVVVGGAQIALNQTMPSAGATLFYFRVVASNSAGVSPASASASEQVLGSQSWHFSRICTGVHS